MEYILKTKPEKRQRFTIGFLDENAYDEYHSYLMAGVFEAARKYDMNVIRFGHFGAHITYKHNYQINMVLDHIQQYDLDGLIFLGWARAATLESHEKFRKRFASIPVLSLGAFFQDIPGVYFPGDDYIHEILLHLIEYHHFKRIAFIAPFWPDNRRNIYIDIMKKYGIYSPELYVGETEIANLNVPDRGRKAVSILLDERKVAVDAIVSLFNDETKAIVDELQSRGFNVPRDIAVTSYEDGEIGRFASPSFTTVYFPWKELGFYSCEKMYELLTYGHIPMLTIVPGKVIIRDSCGCIPRVDDCAGTAGAITAAGKRLEEISEPELTLIHRELAKRIINLDLDVPTLCQRFLDDFRNQSPASFLDELEFQLKRVSARNCFSDAEDFIVAFRGLILPYVVNESQSILWVENLFQQALVLIQEKKAAAWAYEEVRSEMVQLNLQQINQILVTNFNLQKIMDSLEMNLPKIDLPSCYIFIFNHQESQDDLFNDCNLVFEYSGGVRKKGRAADFKAARPELAAVLFPEDRPYAMTAQLLHVGDEFIGFAVFEPGPPDERVYQVLSLNISTALFGVILLEKLDKSYKKLVEQAHREGMAKIASGILHNIGNILNNISVSIHLIKDLIYTAPIDDFVRANRLLEENIKNLDDFLVEDPRGKKLMKFYLKLGESFNDLQSRLLENIYRLAEKITLINDIVTAQQTYTGIRTSLEELDVIPIVEDALKMNLPSLEKYRVKIIKNYHNLSKAMVQKTKLFHVLVNLITNAKDAMLEVPEADRKLTITTEQVNNEKYIRVIDTGHGIPPDLLESIFAYGYTTKKGGHGFGLHSCANYMTEMDGKIWAESDGPGKGATFILQFK